MGGNSGQHNRGSSSVLVDLKEFRKNKEQLPITFHRRELDAILRIYSLKVGEGEWRDYAIDHLKEKAVFSVFQRSSEVPVFRIEKDPRLARKQGAFSVIAASGLIVKRGQELDNVLKVFDKSAKLVRG